MLLPDSLPCYIINITVMIVMLNQIVIYSCHSTLDEQPIKIALTKRAAHDQVNGLPGQTQNLGVRQFSGYLQGIDSNRLHYVFF